MRFSMRTIRRAVGVVVLACALSTGVARAQGVGNCLIFGAWVAEQGGEVWEVRNSLVAGTCFILFYIYGQGVVMPCQCG